MAERRVFHRLRPRLHRRHEVGDVRVGRRRGPPIASSRCRRCSVAGASATATRRPALSDRRSTRARRPPAHDATTQRLSSCGDSGVNVSPPSRRARLPFVPRISSPEAVPSALLNVHVRLAVMPSGYMQQRVDGVRHFVRRLVPVVRAGRHHRRRRLEVEGVVVPRHEVHEQVRRDAAGVVPVAAPPEEPVQIERPLRRRAEELLPVDRRRTRIGRNRIEPRAAGASCGCTRHAPSSPARACRR